MSGGDVQADHPVSGHLDDERLAAFVDGALDGDERAAAELHLAACDTCRVAVAEIVRTVEGLEAEKGAVGSSTPGQAGGAGVRRTAGRRGWLYGAAGLAAAAAVVLAVWMPRGERPELRELVEAVGERRPVEGRLAGGFAYGPPPTRVRGSAAEAVAPDVRIAAAELEKAAAADPSPRRQAAFAVGALASGKIDTAIEVLEHVVASGDSNAFWWNDLAAALVAKAQAPGPDRSRGELAARALDAADRALALTPEMPEALFNRALALELLPPLEAASDAWRAYLRADPSGEWHEEAKARLSRLEAEESRRRQSQVDRKPGPPSTEPSRSEAVCRETAMPIAGADITAVDGLEHYCTNGTHADLRRVAEVIASLRAAERAIETEDFAAADALLTTAEQSLAPGPRSLQVRGHLLRAVAAFWEQRFDEADAALAPLRRDHFVAGHAAIRARVNWLSGSVAWQRGQPAAALSQYEAAADEYLRLGDEAKLSQVERSLAECLRWLGAYHASWRRLSSALARAVSPRRSLETYLTFFSASRLADTMGLPYAAVHFQTEALRAALHSPVGGAEAEARLHRGVMLTRLQRYAEATHELDHVDRLLLAAKDPYLVAHRSAARGMLLATAGHRADALRTLSVAIGALEGRDEPAAASLLWRRARLYRDLSRNHDALADYRKALNVVRAKSLATAPLRGDDAIFSAPSFELFDEAVDFELGLRGRDSRTAFALLEQLRAEQQMRRYPPTTLDGLAGSLPPGVLVAEFAVMDDHTWLWLVRRGEHALHQIPLTRHRLSAMRDTLRRAIVQRQSDTAAELLQTLHDHLAEPIVSWARLNELVVIVPDGHLGAVPFAALHSRETGRYLIEDHALVTARSATAYLDGIARMQARGPAAPVVASFHGASEAPTLYPLLPRLTSAEREAASVAARYVRGSLRTGSASTPTEFLKALKDTDVVHFAGHAVTNTNQPALSGLLFTASSQETGVDLLSAAALQRHVEARSRLVSLGACRTVGTFDRRGDGPIGLASALEAAGVLTIVATIADVDDELASVIMERFHEAYAAGHGAAEALRRIQATMARDKGFADLGWASFLVFGADRGAEF